jgi:hypothetical protein
MSDVMSKLLSAPKTQADHAQYPDRADSYQTTGTVSLVYTFLGDTKFGAVEWRSTDKR